MPRVPLLSSHLERVATWGAGAERTGRPCGFVAAAYQTRTDLKELTMAHVIAQPCVGVKDTACITVCPVDCIHPTPHEPAFAAAELLHIDPDACTDCGLCVDECPAKAIFHEDDLPTEWAGYLRRNADFFQQA
jgi:NAD-dependent dihydropyrimidine dehydrogenase PreA subunit